MDSSRPVWRDLAGALVPLTAATMATASWLTLSWVYAMQVAGLYLCLGVLILVFLPHGVRRRGIGAANRVTLARATLVLPLGALPLHQSGADAGGLWWIVGLAGVAMALDGVDGWVARRWGATAFGARFDMEVDAFLLLALSVLAWQTGKVGPWVLTIGGIRYVFVLAGGLWPCLRADLPPRWRRKAGCVAQGVALLVCLVPLTPPTGATAVAAIAAIALVLSFGIDVVWLVVHASPTSDRV